MTDHILFAEYNSFGPGVTNATRPSFSTLFNASQASVYNISATVGDDYRSWVDLAYLSSSSL